MKTVINARALPHLLGHRIELTWQNPPASDFGPGGSLNGIRIVRRERTFPQKHTEGKVVYPTDTAAQFGPVISHFSDGGLAPLVRYYYTIFIVDNTNEFHHDNGSRVSALAADNYVIDGASLIERLYKMLPGVHQRYDRLTDIELAQLTPEAVTALNALPKPLRGRGPLWRFLRAAGSPLNVMRSSAEALRQLRDTDHAPPQFLPLMAGWLDWELDRTLPTHEQRNEIKFAPRLYRSVGSVPTLSAIASRYTHLYSQTAEFAQHIARSNLTPQLNLFAVTRSGSDWRGTDDAAAVLGLSTTDTRVKGSNGPPPTPAKLTGTNAEPFALRPGMEIAITADNSIPVVVRFEAGDFNNIAAATADEVVGVFNRALSEVTAEATAAPKKVELRSNTVGAESALRVGRYDASMVSLEGAPRGRLSVFTDNPPAAPDHIRLFYETADPLAPYEERMALHAFSGKPFPQAVSPEERAATSAAAEATTDNVDANDPTSSVEAATPITAAAPEEVESPWLPAVPLGRVRYKTFRNGAWGESFPLPVTPGAAQSEPAATTVVLPAGERVFAAWVDKPSLLTDAAPLLGFAPGNIIASGAPGVAAVLESRADGPFALGHGMEVAVTIDQAVPVVVRFAASDFADINSATADEVVRVLDREIFAATVAVHTNGKIRFTSNLAGPTSRVRFESQERLRFALGTARAPQPARLEGQTNAPFNVEPGSRLVVRGNFSEIQVVHFTDLPNPQSATTAQVVAAINGKLTRAVASPLPGGTIALESVGRGGDQRLEIDLQQSSAARALGFGPGNHKAVGDWGDVIDWAAPQDVSSAQPGTYADLFALRAGPALLWLFWSRHVGTKWQVESSRWNGANWTATEVLSSGGFGNREPCAVVDAANRVWLFWSQRSGDFTWTLRRRVFSGGAWGAEDALTTFPAGVQGADREPGAVFDGSAIQVFFNSDRDGGPSLWSITLQPATSTVSGLGAVTAGAAADHAPSPLLLRGGTRWLLFRSSRSVSLSRVATRSLPAIDNRIIKTAAPGVGEQPGPATSVRMSDTGTLRRFVGTTSVVLRDEARIKGRRQWDDLLSYTPQKPLGPPYEAPLADNEFYTRGTVGLYLSQIDPNQALTPEEVQRLLPVLQRFLPVNVRVVVVLTPPLHEEFVYGRGEEIVETFLDKHPIIEFVGEPREDRIAAATPNVSRLESNRAGHVSGDPANLTTLRRRSFFPPPR